MRIRVFGVAKSLLSSVSVTLSCSKSNGAVSLNTHHAVSLMLATDTGISKTLLNSSDWSKVKGDCKFVKTSKRF